MITLENITKIYQGDVRAVNDVSFTVPEGDVCILVGPSGCGKTTLLKMINRLIPPTSGRIYVAGRDTSEVNTDELRRSIGYAIQDIGLFPHLTVAANIAVVPSLKKYPKEKTRRRVDELLELVGLNPDEFRHKYPRQLSGGQQQRVGVARALGADPPILLMDEPFGAIDPITRSRLQDEFLKIQEKLKKTIVFVTHDIDEALKMGDRIALLKEGELVQYDTPQELLAHPRNRFVRDFIGADSSIKRLALMKVEEVMSSDVPTVKLDQVVSEVRGFMEQNSLKSIAVIDENDVPRGWIELSEISAQKGYVRDIISTKSIEEIAVDGSMRVRDALAKMLTTGLIRLLVVDERNGYQGEITFSSLQKILGDDKQLKSR